MVSKRKNKRQQWRRQQQKAKKKEAKRKAKKNNVAQDKWFQERIQICQERFKNVVDADEVIKVDKGYNGVPLPEPVLGFDIEFTNKEMADLLEAVDDLATIWATREWPALRRHHLKNMMPGMVLDETVADMMDEMMPEFKKIEMKKLKIGFKAKSGLPLTHDEHTCIRTGEWGWAKAVENMETQLDAAKWLTKC